MPAKGTIKSRAKKLEKLEYRFKKLEDRCDTSQDYVGNIGVEKMQKCKKDLSKLGKTALYTLKEAQNLYTACENDRQERENQIDKIEKSEQNIISFQDQYWRGLICEGWEKITETSKYLLQGVTNLFTHVSQPVEEKIIINDFFNDPDGLIEFYKDHVAELNATIKHATEQDKLSKAMLTEDDSSQLKEISKQLQELELNNRHEFWDMKHQTFLTPEQLVAKCVIDLKQVTKELSLLIKREEVAVCSNTEDLSADSSQEVPRSCHSVEKNLENMGGIWVGVNEIIDGAPDFYPSSIFSLDSSSLMGIGSE